MNFPAAAGVQPSFRRDLVIERLIKQLRRAIQRGKASQIFGTRFVDL